LDQRLPVSRRAEGMTPSKLYLKVGDTVRVEDAVLALVTKSANDAAVVLAEALGGEEWKFAKMMTERARRLGMRRTT
ncbi:D-alanyl-D-alanine carboxypeptidase, partial [Paraburkholderia sp. SIMBA_061]